MIKLQKSDKPQILEDKAAEWTSRLLSYIRNGQPVPQSIQNKYNHPIIKTTLTEETFFKCMYCESKIKHVSYEHIEHIKPKARDKYPELTFEWENLGLACPICNNNKGDIYDEAVPFINPYVDDPSDHFLIAGHFIYHNPGNIRAELTEKQIDLNRPELIERRKERIDSLRTLADKYSAQTNPTIKAIILEELKEETSSDKPYSRCSKSMFNALLSHS